MANTTNFGWETPDDTDLVKDGAAAIRTLGSAIDTSLVDLKGGTTGQILSKTSNTDMDFTWITNDVGDITAVTAGTGISGGGTTGAVTITNSMATAIDAKGDLIAGTGADAFSRLAVGTNDQVLTADSSTATGLKWATPSSGGMTSIASGSLSGASVTISSIPSGYINLLLFLTGLDSGANSVPALRFNGLSTSIYGSWATGNFGEQSNKTSIWLAGAYNLSGDTRNSFSVTINNYLASYPTVTSTYSGYTFNGNVYAATVAGGGGNTGAVTSITILPSSGSWSSGSYTLYGVK